MSINPGWPVATALVLLLGLALAAHRVSGYGLERAVLVAGLRAIVQLGKSTDAGVFMTDRLWLTDALSVIGSYRLDAGGPPRAEPTGNAGRSAGAGQ